MTFSETVIYNDRKRHFINPFIFSLFHRSKRPCQTQFQTTTFLFRNTLLSRSFFENIPAMIQKKNIVRTIYTILLLGCLGFMGTGCNNPLILDGIEKIKKRGELILITRNNANCFYEGPNGPTGFEYELASAFAEHLEIKLHTVVIEDEVEMIKALLDGKGDILAPGTPFGAKSSRLVAMGPGYYDIRQQVIGRRDGNPLKEVKDIVGTTIWVTPNSSKMETLKTLRQSYPDISWMVISNYSSEELLRMVWNRSLPLTIVESNTMAMNHRFYPELIVHWNLEQGKSLTWAIHPQNRPLRQAMYNWFLLPETQSKLKSLIEYYYQHLENFDYVDIVRFHNRIRDRLSKYRQYFEAAAEECGLDWQLIAAQSYQESHWNPRAKSPTGVRGMMMLTLETSRLMGLKNRLDAKASIYAGTRFLSALRQNIGASVAEPDRTFMALAAYNLGYGHLQDARQLAKDMGQSSDTWRGIRSVLPLLQQKKYYQSLTYGYARGVEAVQYVDRIRTYYKILVSEIDKEPEESPLSNAYTTGF
jgi:membrane-bound lytic murein transglycosylase F